MNEQELRMAMLKAVAMRADEFYERAKELGRDAAAGLTRSKRSQITGLEQVANSALKTSDVFDFIKIRVARQKEWQKNQWGIGLLTFLSQELREERDNLCSGLNIPEQSESSIDVYLLLIREFIKQLSAQYEYSCFLMQEELDDLAEALGG